MTLNVEKIRKNFPILKRHIKRKPIIYFDTACMSLKPVQVVKAIEDYYYNFSGCHGRTGHRIGRETTDAYDLARTRFQRFINANKSEEIVFVRNTTESINLVAQTLRFTTTSKSGSKSRYMKVRDTVVTTDVEHNSNLLPWLLLNRTKGVKRDIVASNEDLTFNIENFEEVMNKNVKLVSMVHTANLTGATIPAKEIIKIAHDHGALVMLDGAQHVPHKGVDVKALNVDFYTFSAHKMLGPTGIGILYGKMHLLKSLSQYMVGGETVLDTTYNSWTAASVPQKFEAGLQNYAGAIGAGVAAEFLRNIKPKDIGQHEYKLNKYLTDRLMEIGEVVIIGPRDPKHRGSILNFIVKGIDSHDLAAILDETANIMVRAGMHCVHSWYNAYKIPPSVRISLYIYNTMKEAEVFMDVFEKVARYYK